MQLSSDGEVKDPLTLGTISRGIMTAGVNLSGKMRNFGDLVLISISITIFSLGRFSAIVSAANCSSESPLVGLSADLNMVQHQLRGSVYFVNDCTFQVSRFDMLAGIDVYWWGSNGTDFYNMTHGFPISMEKLTRTYNNQSFQVNLKKHVTWAGFQVLSVWDIATASDFGHILLEIGISEMTPPTPQSGQDRGGGYAPAPAPGPAGNWDSSESPSYPASAPSAAEREIVGHLQPTMFENCVSLSKTFRLRWTADWERQTLELGLEAVLTASQYMGFGWARPRASATDLMLHADAVVAGIDEKGVPYAQDYYLGDYAECNWDSSNPNGVCPDYVYNGANFDANKTTKLLYGQQIDGITLIRYQRPFQSFDQTYDVDINTTEDMQIIWAVGMMKPSDLLKGNRTPQNHGPNFSHRWLNIGSSIDECLGPMVAPNNHKGEVVTADRGTTLVVASDFAVHYPDPPFPSKVFFINQKEAPLLKVERGVPVTFSVQAGHDIAFYITDNPIGGLNSTQTVYAGGAYVQGVPVVPYRLLWTPNRTTPDSLYYQDYFMQKRGWKIQVMDGGLSDMYNASATLADNKVTLFWTMSADRIYLAVRGEVKSHYLAIAFGSGMVNSFSYVGWVDESGLCYINAYWMDGKKASSIHATGEELSDRKCEQNEGIMSFEFSRPLQPSCSKGTLCKNVIDPAAQQKVVWALGESWTADTLADSNMHTDFSSSPTLISLLSGAAQVEQLQPVLEVHGFMMFIAWGLLLPGGVIGARYLKHLDNNGWLDIHIYSQLSSIVVMLLGLLFAVAELRGFNTKTAHMKVGMLSIVVALWQAVNGRLRPKAAAIGESQRSRRVVWQYIHMYSGRSSVVLGFVSLVTGISQLARRDGVENMKGLQWAIFAWFLAGAAVIGYIEVQGFWSKKGHDAIGFDRVLGAEDEPEDPLVESHGLFFPTEAKDLHSSSARGMEIQLEAMH